MKKTIFLFSFFLLISACSHKKEAELTGTWRQYDINFANDNSVSVDFSDEARLKRQLEIPSIISFYKDNTFTELDGDGNYAFGPTLHISEGPMIDLKFKTKLQKLQYKIETNKAGKEVLTLIDPKMNIAKKYMKDRDHMEAVSDDPFAPENNTWRLNPTKKKILYWSRQG
jgi:hypothetical protein